ncbi:response regulator [Pedobacter sp. MC2016-24]|uniref:PAS domain-containing hybrid sensor histidine kinase/response regulator n=1 Tax=Pedobacter sp. MC2016-24 TaxID=2780090 RepID=UPI0018814302|nr:response regulator [Pedobacter sp. MC2016-24]MBE9598131.1 response regulator [Pedobacter sp. MC2016-24]
MNYHKLLLKQLNKYLPPELQQLPAMQGFLSAVNDSYRSFERDSELAERAFNISEEEYEDLNKKLKYELDVKRLSVDKLKEAVGIFDHTEVDNSSDDLLIIAEYLHKEIDKRKNAESALKIKEEKYRGILANMNLGLMEVDNDEEMLYVNNSFCKMSGYQPEELIGKKVSLVLKFPEFTKNTLKEKNKLRKSGTSDTYEIFLHAKNGEGRWWLVSGAPSYNDQNELIGSIGIHLDITQQKQLELDLIRAKEQAEASTLAKEMFLANMSHEIRTPMNAILGMASQLKKTNLAPNQSFFLNTILSAADSLLIIINDILDLTKIDSGKLTLEDIGFLPVTVIERVVQVMTHKAEEKGINLISSYVDPKLAKILIGDPHRIHQVLLNLVSNAIKFTPKGTVDINLIVVADKQAWQKIKITVRDTGIGMDDAFKSRLFDKFSQEDDTVTRKYGGTGLGMSICKELIRLMGGGISVESEKNVGSSISFILKLRKGNEESLPGIVTDEIDVRVISGRKILVTDDNEINRLLATTILKAYQVNCEEATNGLEALEKIQQNRYDLVLMDVQMPVMDGMEAVKIIRNKLSNQVPIIALTAFALKGDYEKCLEAGFNDYLSKPFEESQLLKIVALWMSRSQQNSVADHGITKTDLNLELFDLSQLKLIGGADQSFIDEIVRLFIELTPKAVRDIRSAYQVGDYQKVGEIAHGIRPSIEAMGISSLKNEILEIQSSAVEYGNSPRLESLINHLERIIGQVISALPSWNCEDSKGG